MALVTTDLQSPAADLITRYAWRWSIEVTFAEARGLLGVGQARNRTENAVRRSVPFGLNCYTITVLWYTLHGHHPNDAADRRERAPWYTTKTEPAFSDMLAKLRRVIIATRFLPITAGRPTDAEIRAVHQAWASASPDLAAGPCQNVESRVPIRSAGKSVSRETPSGVSSRQPLINSRVETRMRRQIDVLSGPDLSPASPRTPHFEHPEHRHPGTRRCR